MLEKLRQVNEAILRLLDKYNFTYIVMAFLFFNELPPEESGHMKGKKFTKTTKHVRERRPNTNTNVVTQKLSDAVFLTYYHRTAYSYAA